MHSLLRISFGIFRNCEQSGLFDRATGACLNDSRDIVGAMVRGFFNDAPDYTLQSVYDNAPRWTVTVKDV